MTQQKTFEETEREIVKLLTFDTRRIANKDKAEVKRQNSENVLTLLEEMKNRFKLSASIEYLTYLIRFYTTRDYRNTQASIRYFMQALNMRFENLRITNVARHYRKMINHRIKDAQQNAQENAGIEVYSGCSYMPSISYKALHFI
jgi:hypothetical protein